MSNMSEEQKYHEGFLGGIQFMIDLWDETNDSSLGRTEHYENFSFLLEEQRKELEAQ